MDCKQKLFIKHIYLPSPVLVSMLIFIHKIICRIYASATTMSKKYSKVLSDCTYHFIFTMINTHCLLIDRQVGIRKSYNFESREKI